MKKTFRSRIIAAALLVTIPAVSTAAAKKTAPEKPPEGSLAKLYEGLEFRNIGPYRGGRVDAVAGVRGQLLVYYFGGTGGGIWKTVDGGSNWQAMSDKDFKTGSVGAIGIAESDPNVIYAGMGEAAIRGNVSHGNGVYKSTDAG
ncbi:MAG TPA: glycosyl hydrolase, partial [Thermoanaerobaculia bacterium]